MGAYLIPGATIVDEAIAWRGPTVSPGESWERVAEGIRYTAPDVDDAEAAARYVGFVPSNDRAWAIPLAVRNAAQIVRSVALADDTALAAMTQAEVRLALRAACRALLYLDSTLDS